MDEQQPLSGKSGIGAVPMQPAEPVQFVGQPPEQERLLAKQAAASLNGPAAVDPEALKVRWQFQPFFVLFIIPEKLFAKCRE